MADVTIHKQEFLIKDLATRSVTLYPARANVVRDINDVCLKPGANEITIYGLTPTTDEHSVKVDGKGTATITDMTVDLVPNRDIFEDVYPSDAEDSDSDSDPEMEEDDNEDVKRVTAELDALRSTLADAQEKQTNATKSLDILDRYGTTVHSKDTKSTDIAATLRACFSERQRVYEIWKDCQTYIKDLEKEIAVKTKEKDKLGKPYKKRVEKFNREKSKKQAKKQRQKDEKEKEKARLKEERMTFWPKKVYRVILHLDAPSPSSSSRRESLIDPKKPLSPASQETITSDHQRISLSLSYITHSASWSPRYDLLLTTPSSSGSIVYRASFKNTTSETWRDAKIVLSTSQTSYQGLGETVPHMGPWHVSLVKGGGGGYYTKSGSLGSGGGNAAWGGGLYSKAEQEKKEVSVQKRAVPNRNALFGLSNDTSANINDDFYRNVRLQQLQQQQQMVQVQAPQAQRAPAQYQASVFGAAPSAPGGGLFRSRSGARHRERSSAIGGVSLDEGGAGGSSNDDNPEWRDNDGIDTLAGADPSTIESLQFQESSREDYGMTTTYDVPGLRTLAPSDSSRRHKIAEIPLHNVQLSYILVPKLRPAAFLKARVRNSSLITLLRGQAGLTLDGTFLGNTTIPRCSAGETFVMPLGVDPSVHVSYAKPTVRRSSSGVFTKEDLVVYTRTCWITNTKPGSAVDLRILDQIPVSEDERLRISVIQPKGLRNEGDSVRTGWDASSTTVAGAEGDRASVASGATGTLKKVDSWGRAVAGLKKSGEVCWDVRLNGGRGCKLMLEYEARIPGGEGIVGIDK
ncbi:MAG: hypothetical protein M1839_002252 [Geoglossum umbratile]|nr:MAG: hypothetical protein M1839_002252 [Geoglossum umbratile]